MKKLKGITIDLASTLDIDDGIWVDRTDSGYTVNVGIANPSGRIMTEHFKRAYEMTESKYYAQGTDHMLPISEVIMN